MTEVPPFRADQVGSLLRPAALKEAHERALTGALDPGQLREIEDRHIAEAIKLQESIGLQAITDGEFRRTSFHADFLSQLDGAHDEGQLQVAGAVGGGHEKVAPSATKPFAPRAFVVTGKLRHARPIEADNFAFVKQHTARTAKQAMPSPTMLLRGGRAAVSKDAYPDYQEFVDDIAIAYRAELAALGAAGCRYIQLDDTNFAYLCDPNIRETFRQAGDDPDQLPARSAALINTAIKGRPEGMVVGVHICRGNSQGRWAAQGGYEPVADVLLNQVEVDAYFLEYDDARSGGFDPLRFFPRGSHKKVVLGLISTKTSALESPDLIKRRLDEAARYVPLANLCLSPQCGFASTFHGNPIDADTQRRKLELVVRVASEVWG